MIFRITFGLLEGVQDYIINVCMRIYSYIHIHICLCVSLCVCVCMNECVCVCVCVCRTLLSRYSISRICLRLLGSVTKDISSYRTQMITLIYPTPFHLRKEAYPISETLSFFLNTK